MEAKTATPADRVYVEFEPSMEWAWDDKWGTLLLYLPGFSKQHLRVQVTSSGMLKLSGERPIGGERWNRFYKEVQIPKNCDTNAIVAKFENGILYVQFPKVISTPAEQQDTVKPQTQPPKPQKPANQPESQREPAKEPQKPVNEPLSDKASQPQMPKNEPHSQGEPKEVPKQKPADEPYTPRDQKTKPKTRTSENTSPEDGKNGVFTETNNAPKKTLEKGDDELGKEGKDIRGASERQGNISDSAEKATKLDQEAHSIACGSGNCAIENYTKVVGSLARDLRQGGKLFNFAVTVLVALLLGLYFGNMIKSSEKPKI